MLTYLCALLLIALLLIAGAGGAKRTHAGRVQPITSFRRKAGGLQVLCCRRLLPGQNRECGRLHQILRDSFKQKKKKKKEDDDDGDDDEDEVVLLFESSNDDDGQGKKD